MTDREYYECVRKTINECINSDKQIKLYREKAARGTATLQDAINQNSHIANLIGATLSDFMPDAESGEGLREYVCREVLKDQHIDTNDMLADVQKAIDKNIGINIEPQTAPFPKERVDQVAHSLEDQTVDLDVIQRRAQSATENIINSYADDYVKENAKLRSDAGLKCYITRITSDSCCKWCDVLAGRYEYGEEPDDVYRRHDNCNCSVTYENGRKRQDVWSKKSWESPETDKADYKPQVLSREQSKAIEAENMRFEGIDKTTKNDIIKEKEYSEATEVIQNQCEVNKVEYNKVNKLPLPLSSDEIIQRLAGGDMTEGSCSSLAFAYIGNINGLDVLDFRGGNSLDVFSQNNTIEKMLELPNIKGSITKVKKEAKGTFELLKGLELDKEYYLAAGEHVAIVRNTKNGLEYLELQSGLESENGWTSFNKYGSTIKTLQKRFGCRKTVDKSFGIVWEKSVVLMDVDSFKDNAEFEHILGYINTSVDKQQKGVNGHVK